MVEDVLNQFTGMAVCPVCGSIEKKGSFRCLGCGAFHSNAHLVDRDAPPPQEKSQETDLQKINPLAYSMGPNQKILEEEFEQSEDVTDWQGGSTDFSFQDDTEPSEKVDEHKVVRAKVEEL
ncbi:MAG TPA: hypothetical protein HA354_04175 [Candidatus Poseidoniaceae archaeon]|nr:hypothetical protein [Euryarchaeota archaeon]DAC58165.1 MAG TPA: hypothetical protein D7I07_04140 [Candidatus Poseidoniales archaeon]HII37674.1 hypothetical protein [Candidatus Poseidoniaceae archaeon]|tara:strand:- start:531 stop:893 length:363 start_codon:yes stop_codon:yes gene_type:complete